MTDQSKLTLREFQERYGDGGGTSPFARTMRLAANHCFYCLKPHGTLKGRNIHMAKVHPKEYRKMQRKVDKMMKDTKSGWTHWVKIPK